VEAGIYVAWERRLTRLTYERLVTPAERAVMPEIPFEVVLRAVTIPDGAWGATPLAARDALLVRALADADSTLRARFGADVAGWAYGRAGYKHVMVRHVLSGLVADSLRARLDVGPAPRGGYGLTLNANGNGDNQTSGASFRIAIDLADWDLALGTNTPGQSGDPSSPFYRDLFGEWARDRYFPVLYTRPKIDAATASRTRLTPR
jgi:penicillin amidase